MKKADNQTRRRRAVPKNEAAPAPAAKAVKSRSKARLGEAAGKAQRDTGAEHPSEGRQRIKPTKAQRAAKSEQLEEFAHVLDMAPAMVRTLDGKILLWGRGLQALYGWSSEEATGRIARGSGDGERVVTVYR